MSDTPRTDALDAELTEREIDRALDFARTIERELAAAQAQRARNWLDAERYRWLRARPVEDCTTPRIEVNVWTCNVNDDGVGDSVNEGDVLAGDALDAAIDKAMLGEKK